MMGTIRGAKSLLDKVITHTFSFGEVQAGVRDQGEQPVRQDHPAPMGELKT